MVGNTLSVQKNVVYLRQFISISVQTLLPLKVDIKEVICIKKMEEKLIREVKKRFMKDLSINLLARRRRMSCAASPVTSCGSRLRGLVSMEQGLSSKILYIRDNLANNYLEQICGKVSEKYVYIQS